MTDYPKRQKCFAYKFCRLMAKICLANELGTDGCWFLTVVAHLEDAKRYAGPVSFWNGQLMPLVGLGSVPALLRVREKLVKSGWLHYTPGTNRRAAVYWVQIPERYQAIEDGPADEQPDEYLAAVGSTSANENVTRTVTRSGIEPLHEAELNRTTSYPCPNPIPFPATSVADAVPEQTTETKPGPAVKAVAPDDPSAKKATKKKPAPKKEPNPVHKPAVEYFFSAWQRKFGKNYFFAGGRDAKAIESILHYAENDLEKFRDFVDRYLADSERFVVDSGHNLTVMLTKMPKLIATTPRPPTEPRIKRACDNPLASPEADALIYPPM